METGLALYFYENLRALGTEGNEAKFTRFKESFLELIGELSSVDLLQFNTLFSRVSYIATRYSLSGILVYHLQGLRKYIESGESYRADRWLRDLGVMTELIKRSSGTNVPEGYFDYPPLVNPVSRAKKERYSRKKKVLIKSIDTERWCARALDMDRQDADEVLIFFDHPEFDESDLSNLRDLARYDLLPMTAMLHHIQVRDESWHPKSIIFEPDYLIGVTSIAESFQPGVVYVDKYLLNKLQARTISLPILGGYIANYFFDELLKGPTIGFDVLFSKTFALFPLLMCQLDDVALRYLMGQAAQHYSNLRRVISNNFRALNLDSSNSMIEPSYYVPSYGLQGRLDFLHQKGGNATIIELKSGRPFRPNIYGTSQSHYIQTMLYDVMIRSANQASVRPSCYILYSKLSQNPLRVTPYVEPLFQEAMAVRNRMVVIERRLCSDDPLSLLSQIRTENAVHIRGFLADQIAQFERDFERMNSIDRAYLGAFLGFIAREHRLAKLGNQLRGVNGLSALWRESTSCKRERYQILDNLQFVEWDSSGILRLCKTAATVELSNFRKGDIVLLYPVQDGIEDVLEGHVLKGTIVSLGEEIIELRMRSMPMEGKSINAKMFWNIEHDLIDSQFDRLSRSVYRFVCGDPYRKNLILGIRAPRKPNALTISTPTALLSEEQVRILTKMISSKDYFLLWGPPGTGKTSAMLRAYVEHFYKNTDETLLVMAYTNRAVDELCAAMAQIEGMDFIRIGSQYACGTAWIPHLLTQRMSKVNNRAEARKLLDDVRIIIGTVSSINGKPELLELKKINRLVIDEASQILEPQIVGLLTEFEHFVLVGDHRQLPAVSLQEASQAKAKDELLRQIGLKCLSDSLFERLFKRCTEQSWHHAYDMLSRQGRMHRELMEFPSISFYDGRLNILDHIPKLKQRLEAPWLWEDNGLQLHYPFLCSKRCIYLNAPVDLEATNIKVNRHEAKIVSKIVSDLNKSICTSRRDYTIGVITPYRAQIATIKRELDTMEIDTRRVSVDTVERYQGSARDIIIISLCVNHPRQIRLLASSVVDGVDRKLNVALTRAREQIILIGNKALLSASKIYADYIRRYEIST